MSNLSFFEAMKARYDAPGWALFYEVGNGTGWHKNRSADAVAMSLYPSRGLDLYGHEFKANRGDWLNELKNPDKAEEIASYCDYWYIVDTNSGNAVKEEEVPSAWGLIVWNGKTLRAVKKAEKLKPRPLDRSFLAGLLRASCKMADAAERKTKDKAWIKDINKKSYDEGFQDGKEITEREMLHHKKQAEDVQAMIGRFEESSGIKLHTYNWGQIAETIRAMQRISDTRGIDSLVETAGSTLRAMSEELCSIAKAIREFCEKSSKEQEKVAP